MFEIAQSSRKRMLEIVGLKKPACNSAAAMVLTELVDSDDKKTSSQEKKKMDQEKERNWLPPKHISGVKV